MSDVTASSEAYKKADGSIENVHENLQRSQFSSTVSLDFLPLHTLSIRSAPYPPVSFSTHMRDILSAFKKEVFFEGNHPSR
jgi:hypothetical protein